MNPALFFIAFLGLFVLLNAYVSRRLISKLRYGKKTKLGLRVFLFINLLGMIGYMLGRYYLDVPNWLYFLFSIPIGVLFLLFCTAVFYDVLRVFLSKTPISISRRDFFKKSLDASALLMATSLSARSIYEASFIELEKISVKINDLKKSIK